MGGNRPVSNISAHTSAHRSYYDSKTGALVDGIMHRDLKPDNCLVSESNSIKIADFGEARTLSIESTMTQVGTPLYVAPEIIRGERYTKSCDVFR